MKSIDAKTSKYINSGVENMIKILNLMLVIRENIKI